MPLVERTMEDLK